MSEHDGAATQAVAALGVYTRILPGLLATCERLTREACERCGMSRAEWQGMTFPEREAALRAARR